MKQRAPTTVASPAEIETGTPDLLRHAADLAIAYRASLPERRVGSAPGLTADALRAALGGPLADEGEDPRAVIDALVAGVEPGLVAMASPRYFGFVIGGSVPAALAADWLTSTWEQNTGLYLATPAASVVEEIAGGWLLDLLGLPPDSSVGFTTGATMAHFTALAAARHAVLRQAGWDVEEEGLIGAPASTSSSVPMSTCRWSRPSGWSASDGGGRSAWRAMTRAGCGRPICVGSWPICHRARPSCAPRPAT